MPTPQVINTTINFLSQEISNKPCFRCGKNPRHKSNSQCYSWCCLCIREYKKQREKQFIEKGLCRSGDGNSLVTTSACKECREKGRRRFSNYVKKVFDYYGRSCVCCASVGIKTTISEFLCLDHVNNDGAAHKREVGGSGSAMVRWIIRNIIRKGGEGKDRFQVLCYNCNCAKGFHGQCPHQKMLQLSNS